MINCETVTTGNFIKILQTTNERYTEEEEHVFDDFLRDKVCFE